MYQLNQSSEPFDQIDSAVFLKKYAFDILMDIASELTIPRVSVCKGKSIVANDAQVHIDTALFTDSYLLPRNISSMLDVPNFENNEMVRIICCQHCGPKRVWSVKEQNFFGSVAKAVKERIR